MWLIIILCIIIAIIAYFLLKKKKIKESMNDFLQTSSTVKCLWQDYCSDEGKLNQYCLDSNGKQDLCSNISNPVKYLKDGTCTCNSGYNGNQCQYSDQTTCSGNGKANMDGTCTCNSDYNGNQCQYSDQTTCSGNGKANTDGTCTCNPSYVSGSCEWQALDCNQNPLCPMGVGVYKSSKTENVVCSTYFPFPCNSLNNVTKCDFWSNATVTNDVITTRLFIPQNVPMVITTCNLFKNGKMVLYRDPTTNNILFKSFDSVKNDHTNFVWRYNTDNGNYYTLSLYSDWKLNNGNSLTWTGMTNSPGYDNSNNERYVYWIDSLDVASQNQIGKFIYGTPSSWKGSLGYNPSTFYIGPNPDYGMIFQDVDAWYGIQVFIDSQENFSQIFSS